MSLKIARTEHGGPKNKGAKGGFWGLREDAKELSSRIRRKRDDLEISDQTREMEDCSDNGSNPWCDTCPHHYYCESVELAPEKIVQDDFFEDPT